MSGTNYISENRPNPGNDKAATCEICGAMLVCLSCGNHQHEAMSLIEGITRAAAREKRLRDALEGLIDDDPCCLDDWGFCQTHKSSNPCSVAAARDLLAGRTVS